MYTIRYSMIRATEVVQDTVVEVEAALASAPREQMEERTVEMVRTAPADQEEMAQDLTCQR